MVQDLVRIVEMSHFMYFQCTQKQGGKAEDGSNIDNRSLFWWFMGAAEAY